MEEEFVIEVANESHVHYVPEILKTIEDATKVRGTGIAKRNPEYVKKKMEYVKGWYVYDVLNKLCQGIGRGVRYKDDWCKTYILDGCIEKLIGKLSSFNALNGRFKQI